MVKKQGKCVIFVIFKNTGVQLYLIFNFVKSESVVYIPGNTWKRDFSKSAFLKVCYIYTQFRNSFNFSCLNKYSIISPHIIILSE